MFRRYRNICTFCTAAGIFVHSVLHHQQFHALVYTKESFLLRKEGLRNMGNLFYFIHGHFLYSFHTCAEGIGYIINTFPALRQNETTKNIFMKTMITQMGV
jgi:hypothetical protein